MSNLLDLLREPSIEKINVDGEDRLIAHRNLLARKRMLREVFVEFHNLFNKLDKRYLTGAGKRIELGSGVAPIRDTYPDVLATDVLPSTQLDKVIDAEDMDLPDSSVRVVFGQNCFHHFPHPNRFFSELERVLVPGGGVILIEPYYGLLAAFMYKRLFKTEGFDKSYPSWETPVSGPMNGANQALSYIIFERDKIEFHRRYPGLKIVHKEVCRNHLKYLISGGLNFRQILPGWMTPVIGLLQVVFAPFNRWISLHHVIVIRKEI